MPLEMFDVVEGLFSHPKCTVENFWWAIYTMLHVSPDDNSADK